MQALHALADRLRALHGRGYPAYKSIAGKYDAGSFRLVIDHVQGDPFAEPSRLRVFVPPATTGLPDWALRGPARITATADFLNRRFADALARTAVSRGSGGSGELTVLRPGQEVLVRSCIIVSDDGAIEARFRAGLPARGRTILGAEAAAQLTEDVPRVVAESLRMDALDADALRRHVEVVEDARALRAQLEDRGLVAFVADGARLPRRSGIDDRPLVGDVVTFPAPDTLRVVLHTPNSGDVAGLGVPRGVTLIVGGGFHGKSTLLRAIERGVYDHVPGDGREFVVTSARAVKVRAEDGRSIAGTDISNFIGVLPFGGDTRSFHTANASGSTSQAAAIVEALEVGADTLLLDEDTSATNFMIRDARMQALIATEHEPITPFIDRARQLHDELGVSSIIVVGGSGDYFDVADTVIAMRDYAPANVTAEARRIAAERPTHRSSEARPWQPLRPRVPLPESIDPRRGRRDVDIKARSEQRVMFGTAEIELSAVEQLVEPAQARAIAFAIARLRGNGVGRARASGRDAADREVASDSGAAANTAIDGRRTMAEAAAAIMDRLDHDGLDAFQPEPAGELAAFRIFELAAFLGRIRSLRVGPPSD